MQLNFSEYDWQDEGQDDIKFYKLLTILQI